MGFVSTLIFTLFKILLEVGLNRTRIRGPVNIRSSGLF